MGTSYAGVLLYGYDLGSADTGWQLDPSCLTDGDPDGDWRPRWAFESDADQLDRDVEPDLLEHVELELLRGAGFDEEWPPTDGGPRYWARRRDAQARSGVQVLSYGVHDYRRLALVTYAVSGFGPLALDLEELHADRYRENWDALLASACATLGALPLDGPGWFLAVDVG